MAPSDQNIGFALACMRLQAGDAAGASALFGAMAHRYNVRECWTGLAVACLQAGDRTQAQSAAQHGLAGHAADPALASVAAQVVRACNLPGWCGLHHDGTLLTDAPSAALVVSLDGETLAVMQDQRGLARLPAHWRQARRLAVRAGDVPLLGSPIELDAITRIEGFVSRNAHGIEGWACAPRAPELTRSCGFWSTPRPAGCYSRRPSPQAARFRRWTERSLWHGRVALRWPLPPIARYTC